MKEERLQDLETGRKGLTLGEAIKYADTYNVSMWNRNAYKKK